MMTLTQIATAITATGIIGGGALTLDKMHVPAQDFKEYIQMQQASDERDYILKLKKDIREIKLAMVTHPDEAYLVAALADALDGLCELRPEDTLCKE